MSRKKAPTVAKDGGVQWNDDDFNLDSCGVEAPKNEVFAGLARDGYTPEMVSADLREKYAKYLARMKKTKEKEQKKAEKTRKTEK